MSGANCKVTIHIYTSDIQGILWRCIEVTPFYNTPFGRSIIRKNKGTSRPMTFAIYIWCKTMIY